MSISDLRDAFNAAAGPKFTCRQAFMDIVRDAGEWQVLTFFGTGEDGATFEVKSDKLPPNTDLSKEAQGVAKKLIEGV